jgi:hypothetical protein
VIDSVQKSKSDPRNHTNKEKPAQDQVVRPNALVCRSGLMLKQGQRQTEVCRTCGAIIQAGELSQNHLREQMDPSSIRRLGVGPPAHEGGSDLMA